MPRLITIDERPPPPGEGPGAAFWLTISKLEDVCMFAMDAETGIRSTDRKMWRELCSKTNRQITRGRKLTSEKAAQMQKEMIKKAPELTSHWVSMKGTPEFNRVAQHWRDPKHSNM